MTILSVVMVIAGLVLCVVGGYNLGRRRTIKEIREALAARDAR